MRNTKLEKLCSSWEKRAQVILSECDKSTEPDEKRDLEHLAAINLNMANELKSLLNYWLCSKKRS